MSRHRRMLYVELNRRLWLYVIPHGKKDQDDAVLWVSDFFEMSIPEPDSPYDVWLVRNLNEKHPRWLKISDYSLDEIGLYNDMTPTRSAMSTSRPRNRSAGSTMTSSCARLSTTTPTTPTMMTRQTSRNSTS